MTLKKRQFPSLRNARKNANELSMVTSVTAVLAIGCSEKKLMARDLQPLGEQPGI
jgi:hypothetical protein